MADVHRLLETLPEGADQMTKRSYTLNCAPVSGTLPYRASACSKLARFTHPFAATPKDTVCTELYGGPQEARVLRSPRSGLRVVFRSANWTVYELKHATPLLTGPAHPVVTSFGHTVIRGRVFAAGHYLLRAHYNPYWRLQGAGCAAPGPDKMTILELTGPERFALGVPGTPDGLVRELFGGTQATCTS